EPGTLAPGSLVTARTGARTLTEHVLVCGGYLGSSEPRVTFGLGDRCFADVSVVGLDGALERARLHAGEVLRSDTTR
ncbi:MAG: ASPIC/UnbV domain-containing protein, partial [Myxococcales bacterium]|nr:ASPIC/UnbV domain-containing protein [Myxococcales bacterium]